MARITPALFDFFRDLKKNNNREWFQANKDRYELDVKEPLLTFIAEFAQRAPEISSMIMAVPRVQGGSLFRIYRDVRFSKDKTPYKTGAGVHFRHKRGKDVHAPGYYLHLEPGEVFMGAGIWKPETSTLNKIRTKITEHPEQWTEILGSKDLQDGFSQGGDSLKRPPRGFDLDHPLIEELKGLEVDTLTPLEAINRLYEWQKRFIEEEQKEDHRSEKQGLHRVRPFAG